MMIWQPEKLTAVSRARSSAAGGRIVRILRWRRESDVGESAWRSIAGPSWKAAVFLQLSPGRPASALHKLNDPIDDAHSADSQHEPQEAFGRVGNPRQPSPRRAPPAPRHLHGA